ncbi:hypothetical protein M404DRAFT_1003898 [Pisolithus tinctorius Marx 270]|uniref:Uncharacterized protein n=1 Tax=Pisolithus tinctorius Marx 270 TaxID=870435 RepID=A0A0C3NZC0_PISTI|nr:hypothetical protein M404DRAFT_1003898 [Pisolithus tinctorius Marx 270]
MRPGSIIQAVIASESINLKDLTGQVRPFAKPSQTRVPGTEIRENCQATQVESVVMVSCSWQGSFRPWLRGTNPK